MALWCRNIPVVTARCAADPKRVTLVMPFYENHVFFARQLAHWATYDEALRPFVSAVVVDDGSPVPAVRPSAPPITLRMYRIEVDLRWNWLAARNIGAHHSEDGWLLLTDMDHQVPEETLRAIVLGQHDPKTVYAFRRREHTGEDIAPHSASFLMTRAMFWKIGGYDEALSGHYGTDGPYRRRVAATARMAVLTDHLVRFEYVEDSSTTRYLRKQPEDAAVRRIVAARAGMKPKTLSFPYHEVHA